MTDLLGRPVVLRLSPGNVSDIAMAETLLDAAPTPTRRRIADKEYDANARRGSPRPLRRPRGDPGSREP